MHVVGSKEHNHPPSKNEVAFLELVAVASETKFLLYLVKQKIEKHRKRKRDMSLHSDSISSSLKHR